MESYLICDASEDSSISHEPLGWHLAISRHTVLARQASKRVGLITDHDLGKHADINASRTAYFDGIALPPGVKLLYASSDKADNFANQLVRHCDTAATTILDRFSKFQMRQFLYPDPIEFGSAFCFRVRVSTTPRLIHLKYHKYSFSRFAVPTADSQLQDQCFSQNTQIQAR